MKTKLLSVLKQNIFIRLDYGHSKNQFDYFRGVIALFTLFHFLAFLLDYTFFLAPDGIVNWEVTNASAFWDIFVVFSPIISFFIWRWFVFECIFVNVVHFPKRLLS